VRHVPLQQSATQETKMNFQQAVMTCFQKYVVFEGRASRSEYWWFFPFNIVLSMIATTIHMKVGNLVSLLLLLPSLAVGVRRLHDIGKSGWFMLIWLIPLIGWILMIYWAVQPGQPEANAYGELPAAKPPAEQVPYRLAQPVRALNVSGLPVF
jgi:uncharacterized membrane protein YhaH (DUF805 family)